MIAEKRERKNGKLNFAPILLAKMENQISIPKIRLK
jgi:hypothetical protein